MTIDAEIATFLRELMQDPKALHEHRLRAAELLLGLMREQRRSKFRLPRSILNAAEVKP